jgi:hypothetical protein
MKYLALLAISCLALVGLATPAGADNWSKPEWVAPSIDIAADVTCGISHTLVYVDNTEREDAIVHAGFLPVGTRIPPGTTKYTVALPFTGSLTVYYQNDNTLRTTKTVHLSKPMPCPTSTTTSSTSTTQPQDDDTTSTTQPSKPVDSLVPPEVVTCDDTTTAAPVICTEPVVTG